MELRQRQAQKFEQAMRDVRRATFAPPPDLTLGAWAEQYFYLSPEASALPGRFRFSAAPFQKGVFDALTDDNYKKVVIMSASQILKTTALIAYIGYIIDCDPGPILNVQPTIKLAATFSKDRIDTLVRDTPVLHGKITDKRFRDSGNTKMHKMFPQGALTIATSNSPSDLAARPIRYLLCDEIDRYEPNREGDPIDLAAKRTTTYWNSKTVLVSSPGDEEISRIAHEYKNSDKRIFMVPCHLCKLEQQLMWKQLNWKFETEEGIVKDPSRAYYECEGCGEHWNDTEKNKNIAKGHWIITNPESKVAGFHISSIYSSFITMEELVDEWYEAKDDPEQHRTFINTRLAETWKTDATAVGDIQWLNRVENYHHKQMPEGVVVVTAGIDVQIDRLEMEVVGWGVGDESWSLGYHVIQGDPTSPTPWVELKQRLKEVYKRKDGITLRIAATCIDAQGTATQDVFNFVKKHRKANIYAIRGTPGSRPMFPRRFGRWKGSGERFYAVGVDTGKERLYQHLRIEDHGPAYCHFPQDRDQIYFDGLTAEKYITKYKNGHPYKKWFLKAGTRNEPLDCRVYAMAARYSLRFDMVVQRDTLLKKAKEIADGKQVQQVEDTPVSVIKAPKAPNQPIKKPKRPRRPGGTGYISKIT